MSYRITLQPSGRSFTALPEETLLEAALRSGINITYNCSSGTCGDCRVRLLEGKVEAVKAAGYRFSQQQLNENFILMCTNRAASDLVLEAQEALSPSDIPLQQLTAKVAKVEEPSPGVRILHLRTPRTRTLRFMAGQHVCLTLPGVGSCDAAIASCPCNGQHLQFHLPADGGPVAEAVFSGHVRVGKKLQVAGPYGDVTLDDLSERPLLLIGAGTDFASLKSLIEHAINLDLRQPVRLIWLSGEQQGHYQENHCRAWGEVLDDYRYIPLDMRETEPDASELAALGQVIAEEAHTDADAYIAGARPFREAVRDQLQNAGLDDSRLFELKRRYARRSSKANAIQDSSLAYPLSSVSP